MVRICSISIYPKARHDEWLLDNEIGGMISRGYYRYHGYGGGLNDYR